MSYPTVFAQCPDIQDLLDNNFQTNGSAFLVDQHPFAEYNLSAANRSGLQAKLVPGQGKIKTYQLVWDQRILESEVTQPNTTDRACSAETKRGNLSDTVTIDPATYWEVEQAFEVSDFTYACQDNAQLLAIAMTKMVNALRSKVATAITAQAGALLGGLSSDIESGDKVDVGGTDFIKLSTEISANVINPRTMAKLNFLKQQMNWAVPSPIFGGGDLYQYYQLMQAGCCSTQGIDLSAILAQYGVSVSYDRRVADAAGGNEYAWMVAPGALQTVFHVENDNGLADALGIIRGSDYEKRVIYDPMLGFPIDLTLRDSCDAGISVFMRANPKVFAMSELFQSGDHMEDVNWFAGIKVVNS